MRDEPGAAAGYDALGCLVLRVDRQLTIDFANRCALQLLGYARLDQLAGQPLQTLLPADEAPSAELLAGIRALTLGAAQDAPSAGAADLLRADGSRLALSWTLSGDAAPDSAATLLVGFEASAMRRSQAAAAMFQTVCDHYNGSIVITDSRQRIVYANPALLQISGYAADEVLGKTPALFKSGLTPATIYRQMWQALETAGRWRGELINRRKDGGQHLESLSIAAIGDSPGRPSHYLAIGEDPSQHQQYQQRIESLLTVDQLTGLPNRSGFLCSLVGALDAARRDQRQATVLHVDIDDFFAVNESVGAGEADQLIAESARQIKAALRQADRLARLGNDKFAVLLGPHEAGIDKDISDVAQRVLAAVRGVLPPTRSAVHLTASIGIASYPADGNDAGELLSHALNATERAKTGGGNMFCRFDASSASSASGRRELLGELHRAVERGEMRLHFQPQVSLVSGAMVGLEALIRWQHPQRGQIAPGEFIPLIEQSHHIIELGEWVLNESCRQMRAWLDAGLPPIKVAINLAARHFLVPGLQRTIADALAGQRLAPRYLEIEITEGAMMLDVDAAIRSTTQLKEVGVRLSLDDFGTGYSSLAYLSRFPIDVVKIDQSFVSDITSNPVNAAIAQATIAMSHKLGKVVLAEGVETEEQMQYLRRNECDEMQGYYFSPPLPAADATRLLHQAPLMAPFGRPGSQRRSTVLLVDDEVNVLAALKRSLRREGYEILTAESASEAFSLLARHEVQLIVSDQRMPVMNGTEFLARVKSLYPATVRMVLSGYAEISAVTDSINRGAVYRFMLKPWDDELLKREIAGALRHWRELHGSRKDGGER